MLAGSSAHCGPGRAYAMADSTRNAASKDRPTSHVAPDCNLSPRNPQSPGDCGAKMQDGIFRPGLIRRQLERLRWLIFGFNQTLTLDAYRLASRRNPRVLVVGANRGEDCRLFVRLGAGEVHGLDIIDDIGAGFPAGATYQRGSIEHSGLPSDYFDIVWTANTMEHVPDIQAGFSEMARITRPGGIIFSVATKLWHSPYGHHMECFHGHPWVHVVFTKPQILEYARQHSITGERGHTIEAIVDYMLDRRFFNMMPAAEYLRAPEWCERAEVIENRLETMRSSFLRHPLGQCALRLGIPAHELLAHAHHFAARRH
jgi:SAM-dependent methyltransferase